MYTHRIHDPFSVNPIRRSLAGGIGSFAVMAVPFLVSDDVGASVMLSVGWIALAVLIFCLPVFFISVGEELLRIVTDRVQPPVTELEISDRLVHILSRHGVRSIEKLNRLDYASLHLMANMEARDIRSLERALSLWRYRRWQNAGFPDEGGY
jgi:hypothetical protein